MDDYSIDPFAKHEGRKAQFAIPKTVDPRRPSIYTSTGRRASAYPAARRRSSAISQVIVEGDYVVKNETYRRKSIADVNVPTLRTGKDGETILIPQPSEHPDDPLNWSWRKKHSVLFALASASLLADWGMTWGSTLFEAQAAEWHMSIPDVANSISGGIFLQGAGGVLAVPLAQRYGRYITTIPRCLNSYMLTQIFSSLPILFWSQFLSCIVCIGAALSPSYVGFTACRTLQGLFNTAPQIVGLSVINDIFFFHERTRKINIWAWSFLCGPFIGPLISGLLLIELSWRQGFFVLAGMYGLTTCIVAIFGDETLFDRDLVAITQRREKGIMTCIKTLAGIQGVKDSVHRPSLRSVMKHLLQICILPYLLLPSKSKNSHNHEFPILTST